MVRTITIGTVHKGCHVISLLPRSARVNNCVGYSNYKFFVLFLFYTVVLCLFFCVTGLYDVVRAWVGPPHCTNI